MVTIDSTRLMQRTAGAGRPPLSTLAFVWACVALLKLAPRAVARGRVSIPTGFALLSLAPPLCAWLYATCRALFANRSDDGGASDSAGAERRLVLLAVGLATHALLEGARSNHVVVELCLCASVLLSAACARGSRRAGSVEAQRLPTMVAVLRDGVRVQVSPLCDGGSS